MRYDKLGPVLRVARGAHGLEQADVARALEVGQQAVSAWELGTSRPRVKQLPALAALLGLEVDELRDLGDYEQHRALEGGRPRLLTLPFDALSDEAFEAFCRDLARAMFPRREATRNGSTGFKQFGVDVIVDGEGERIGIQCKRHETFGPSQVSAAIRAVLPTAHVDKGVIALSRSVATPRARLEVAKNPDWVMWDGEDLSSRVRGLSDDVKLTLVDAYFPGLREPFLGISAPSPWRQVSEFDTTLAGRLGYDRNFDLTGRDNELDQLHELLSQGAPVAFVVGRGGIGKSRLLSELGRTEPNRVVRYASGEALAAPAFELLPVGDPVIVVDDAGDLDSRVSELVTGIRVARPDATIVMAARPRTFPDLLARLRMTEQDAANVKIEVGDLDLEHAERLARRALGAEASADVVERLGRVGYDCPLLIMIGAHLLRNGHVSANSIGSSYELRQELLTHFADVVVRGAGKESRRIVLDALAALQPANLDQAETLSALLSITGIGEAEILDCVDDLEDLGVGLRRAATVRVVPDMLGEAVLERALVGSGGRDRRFAAALAGGARGTALTNAIRNVSIVDWRRRSAGESQLADVLWGALEVATRTAGNTARMSLVAGVEDVAAIYPERALQLAAAVIADPKPDEPSELGALFGHSAFTTSEDCNRSLAKLIRNAAYNSEYLERCMDLLRLIGKDDARPENQNPEHATRLLRELGDYANGAAVAVHLEYVQVVVKWIAETESDSEAAQLVGLLKASLADEITVTRSRGLSIEFSRRPINLDVTEPVRRAVVDAANELAFSGPPPVAMSAIDLLEEALRTGDRADPVTDEFRAVALRLGDLMASGERPPSVRLSAYRALGWYAHYGEGDRQDLAREMRARLVEDLDLLVTRMVRGGWAIDDDDATANDRFNYEAAQREHARIVAKVIAHWEGLPDDEAVDHLLSIVRDEEMAMGRFIFPDQLAANLFEIRPGAARRLLEDESLDAVGRAAQAVALAVLFAVDEPAAVNSANRAMDTGEEGALVVASGVLRLQGEPLGQSRTLVVRRLRSREHSSVERALVGAMRWFNIADRDLAIEIIMTTGMENDSRLAAEVAAVLTDDRVISWETLSDAQRGKVLDGLAAAPNVSDYSIEQLLARQLAIDPFSVLRLWLRRIENPRESSERYEPIPHGPVAGLNFRASADFPAVLSELVEWLAKPDDWRRSFYGQDLFELVVGTFDAEVLEILRRLISSRDESQISLAAGLLGKAGHGFLRANVPFVTAVLAEIESYPDDWAKRIRAGLHGSAIYGMRSRAIGEDDPAEVSLRDDAKRIASEFPFGSAPHKFYSDVAAGASRRLLEERADDRTVRETRKW